MYYMFMFEKLEKCIHFLKSRKILSLICQPEILAYFIQTPPLSPLPAMLLNLIKIILYINVIFYSIFVLQVIRFFPYH